MDQHQKIVFHVVNQNIYSKKNALDLALRHITMMIQQGHAKVRNLNNSKINQEKKNGNENENKNK